MEAMKQSNIIRRSKRLTIAERELQRKEYDNGRDAHEFKPEVRGAYDLIYVEGKTPNASTYDDYIKASKETSSDV